MKKPLTAFRTFNILFVMTVISLALWGVYLKVTSDQSDFGSICHDTIFKEFGLEDIESQKIVQVLCHPTLNYDYLNRTYLVILRFNQNEFDHFLRTNDFKRDNFLKVPAKPLNHERDPTWWNPPTVQTECFSKQSDKKMVSGQPMIVVTWTNGMMYLFGQN